MHATEIDMEPCNFEVILYSPSWRFSTFAECFCAQAALETAEKNHLAHAAAHNAYGFDAQATSAFVISGGEKRFFRRRNGEWQIATYPAVPGGLAKMGSPVAEDGALRRAVA